VAASQPWQGQAQYPPAGHHQRPAQICGFPARRRRRTRRWYPVAGTRWTAAPSAAELCRSRQAHPTGTAATWEMAEMTSPVIQVWQLCRRPGQ
jgi:hypothetical protein